MAEEKKEELENLEEIKEEVVESEEDDTPPEKSEEEIAREKGWKPKEEFDGDEDTWVDAKEFLSREPLYKALHKQSRDIKRLRQINTDIKKMLQETRKTSYEQAMKDLKAEYDRAAEEQDVKAAIEVRDKMQKLEKESKEDSKDNPEFNEWIQDNEWYNTDPVLKRYAIAVAHELFGQNQDIDLSELYTEVTKQVKEAFPEKFGVTKKRAAAVAERGTRTSSDRATNKKGTATYDQLPEDAKVLYRRLVKSKNNPNGVFSHEEYMKEYVQSGGPLNQE